MAKRMGTIGTHLIGWFLYTYITFRFAEAFQPRYSNAVPFIMICNVFLVLTYYLNTLLLIPKFLLRKKIVWYLLCIAGIFTVYYWFPTPFFKIDSAQIVHAVLFRFKLRLFVLVLLAGISLKLAIEFFITRKKQIEYEQAKTQAEMNLLKAQINPHFLFNTLYSIYNLVVKKSDDAPEAIITLSDMMRYVINDCKAEKVKLLQELTYIDKYIELQKLRISNKTTINYVVNGTVEVIDIAPLLLIPFIENAFKYGISSHTESSIDIIVNCDPEKIELQTRNQKFDILDSSKSNKVGIDNAIKRLDILYQNDYSLDIQSNDKDYFVNLTIKLQ